MSVSSLGWGDFYRYYRGAYFLNPVNGKPCTINDADAAAETFLLRDIGPGNKVHKVSLKDITWQHVKLPMFGYRTIGDGAGVCHFSRKPGRVTSKGVRGEVLVTTFPAVISAFRVILPKTDDAIKAFDDFERKIASIYDAVFTTMAVAIPRLLNAADFATGFALSHDFAVTLWPKKGVSLVMYYEGGKHPCASSKDGNTWIWHNKAAEDAVRRQRIL